MATHSTRYPVIKAFMAGKAKRDGSAMHSDGVNLWSYGMKLAYRDPESGVISVLVDYDECPTATTKYHYRAMSHLITV